MKYQAENAVSSFFYYMWNAWSEEECRTVFKEMYPHFWEKWSLMTDKGVFGASERFYAELTDHYREKLVERAVSLYDGKARRKLLVERAVSLYDGKARRKLTDDSRIRVCSDCGSAKIEIQAWVDSTRTNITVTWTTSSAPGARTMWRPTPDNPFLKRCRDGGSPTTPKPLNT